MRRARQRCGSGSRRRVTLVWALAGMVPFLALAPAGPASARPGSPAGSSPAPYFAVTDLAPEGLPGDREHLVGEFTQPGLDDIIWYGTGKITELRWSPCVGCPGGPFTETVLPQQVSGTYRPLVGDFAGDGLDDIFWWAPQDLTGSDRSMDYLWTNDGSGHFTATPVDMAAGGWNPIVLSDARSGGGKDDILWSAWHRTSPLWVFPDDGSGKVRTAARLRVPHGIPWVGDFDGNGAADIVFYDQCDPYYCTDPAAPPDAYWRRTAGDSASFTRSVLNITGTYAPVVGQFSASGGERDDILWLGIHESYRDSPWDGPDFLWQGLASGRFASSKQSVPYPTSPLLLRHPGSDRVLTMIDGDVWENRSSGSVLLPTNARASLDAEVAIFEWFAGRFTTAGTDDVILAGDPATQLLHPTS